LDLSLLRCGKGENEWFMQKRNDLDDSFNEIVFQIDWLSDYINWGWFDSTKFMSRKENWSVEKSQTCTEERKESNIYIYIYFYLSRGEY
jgi:hypothetical protein